MLEILPQFCRLDGSYGHVLINNKNGNFTAMPQSVSGLNLPGQTRDILTFKYKKEDCILFLENNEIPVMYKIKSGKK